MLLQAHRIALRLGQPDVAAFLHSIPAPQLWHWFALNRIDPWTEDRADLRAAIVASVTANASGARRRFSVEDFMPDFDGAPKADTPEAMKALLHSLAKA